MNMSNVPQVAKAPLGSSTVHEVFSKSGAATNVGAR